MQQGREEGRQAKTEGAETEGTGSAPYRRSVEEILAQWKVEPEDGLTEAEAKDRQRRYGANRLEVVRRKSIWRILLNQFESLVVLLLLAAAGTAAIFGQFVEALAIAGALVINAAVGFGTEYTATRSMDALRRMGQMTARVRRGGKTWELPARALVPGDIVVLQEGSVVPADLRLIEVENLQCNEAALTGESEPMGKRTDALSDSDVPLAERLNMAFKGTAVVRGAAEGVVVGIGKSTEIGRISELVEEAQEDRAPLERRLERLGHRLIFLVLGVGVVVAASGILAGKELLLMIETAIVLAIAAVPEGLPVVSTLSLGRGMWRMARRNALVKQLSAVETLGATTVILADKTGTLTENRMVMRRLALADGEVEVARKEKTFRQDGEAVDPDERPDIMAALRVAVLCNNAEVAGDDGEANGDPMEVALLEGGAMAGLQRGALLNEQPEEREESFDPDTKMMATFHRRDDGCLIAIKGAPEAVIEVATRVRRGEAIENLDEEGRRTWRERNESLAADGLRVLALAEKTVDDSSAEPYEEVTLIGLAGLYDPPRESVAEAIRACREAGIRVVMVTGDQAATALNVGREVGIIDDGEDAEAVDGGELSDASPQRLRSINVFSRVSPEQKLTLAAALQDAGEIVAMTGDGVNDAPALKKADIGIAMGQRGTDVARDAGDIVLKDDAFETIVMAVRQGRSIFANIRRFVVFLLSGNLGQVLAISLAALLGAPLPLLPLQILYLNMLLDVFPALALGMGEDETSVMEQPPRDPDEAILTRDHWLAITAFGLVIAGSVLAAFAISLLVLDMEVAAAVTVSFLTYAFARLWHLFNMRSPDSGLFRNNVVTNPYVWTAIVLCVGLIVAALYFAPLAALLQLSAPGVEQWLLVAAGSLTPLVLGQAAIAFVRQRRRDEG